MLNLQEQHRSSIYKTSGLPRMTGERHAVCPDSPCGMTTMESIVTMHMNPFATRFVILYSSPYTLRSLDRAALQHANYSLLIGLSPTWHASQAQAISLWPRAKYLIHCQYQVCSSLLCLRPTRQHNEGDLQKHQSPNPFFKCQLYQSVHFFTPSSLHPSYC